MRSQFSPTGMTGGFSIGTIGSGQTRSSRLTTTGTYPLVVPATSALFRPPVR